MNPYEMNPFQVLYVTDDPDPGVYVDLFSDVLVVHSSALFQPGNVVLRGTQGSGKSMLLNLLKPAIRLQYHQRDVPFPVGKATRKFVGAGINLSLSGILNIGQRPISSGSDDELQVYPLYFADFLNYYVVRDLLSTIQLMDKDTAAFNGIVNATSFENFAKSLAEKDCWLGFLRGCDTYGEICNRIDKRLASYKAFHQYNSDIPREIQTSKTAIGEPIAATADCLKSARVISPETPVFVCIDQIERLYRSDVLRPELGSQYRRMINKAIGSRDSRISYRIGTRPYAWDDDLTIYGTDDKLEDLRDYRRVDLDEMLRRKEDSATWIYPDFARDAFARRLQRCHYRLPKTSINSAIKKREDDVDIMERVFGATPPPRELAREYAGTATAERVLNLDEAWHPDWLPYLKNLFSKDPLDATLAAAWARQRGRSGKRGNRLKDPPPRGRKPWKDAVWRADRMRQCVTQIAARCAQRVKWSGKDDILALSSGNISIFLSICHEMWDSLLRAERRKPISIQLDLTKSAIPRSIQAVGIQTASTHWYEKISERPKGHDRQRFVDVLGALFRKYLLDDNTLSYPGHNGFSLSLDELNSQPKIRRFLCDAVDYGDLYDAFHTTKEANRKTRRKWYLAPILSVKYQIPEAHKKEPYYATIEDVINWLTQAKVVLPGLSTIGIVRLRGNAMTKASKSITEDSQSELPFK